MFYIVGVTETCKRIAVCNTEQQASKYIGTLPDAEQGIYYIDGCTQPVTLTELTVNDLPDNSNIKGNQHG